MSDLDRPTAFPLARDVLLVAGADAESYLQGQVSQDVEAMGAGDSARSFVLAPNGKVTAWFRITRRADDWVLDTDAGTGEALAARLTRFLLRTDTTVVPVQWQGVALRGPDSRAVGAELRPTSEIVADAGWPGIDGVDLLGPLVVLPDDLAVGDPGELEARRIEAGVPAMGSEIDESTIPAATGMVGRSVSFTKGCYTGQELVARINSRGGSTPTRLCRARVADGDLSPGAILAIDGDDVATVTSVAPASSGEGTVALAYVKRAVEVPARAAAADGVVVDLLALAGA
jgi:folate-binding protein YgfZ